MLGRLAAVVSASFLLCAGVQAEPLEKGFRPTEFNGSGKPVTKNGITTFQIFPEQCSKVPYGDDRGESDCDNGNIRSTMWWASNKARMGETFEYRFDVKVNSDFAYPGYYNDHARGFYPDTLDSRLRIASWEGPLLHNFLYMLKLDTKNGMSFLARQCQAPEQFGNWVAFSMKIRWAADNTGWIKVSCNDHIIYADEGVATDQSPHCYITNVCEPDIVKHPDKIGVTLGPVLAGFGYEWKKYGLSSPFTKIQENGITVEMRNISIRKGAVLYEAADKEVLRQLQDKLVELGCDPGSADGSPSQNTRAAALACRVFPEGSLPAKLTVATAPSFLAAYQAAGVADLPTRSIVARAPGVDVRVSDIRSEHQGDDKTAGSFFRVLAKGFGGPLDFGLNGYVDSTYDLTTLAFTLDLAINEKQTKKVRSCGIRVDNLKRGGNMTEVKITRVTLSAAQSDDSLTFVFPKSDCFLGQLPTGERSKATFLLSRFGDIAAAMAASSQIADIHHAGVERFITRVAAGEIVVKQQ